MVQSLKDQSDPRTSTILWVPDVITDKNGKATFTFLNTGRKANFRIEAEGIAQPGTATRGETHYIVK